MLQFACQQRIQSLICRKERSGRDRIDVSEFHRQRLLYDICQIVLPCFVGRKQQVRVLG